MVAGGSAKKSFWWSRVFMLLLVGVACLVIALFVADDTEARLVATGIGAACLVVCGVLLIMNRKGKL